MLTLPRSHIISQDDIFGEIDSPDGLVTATGESPNCTVKISVADRESRKYVQVDRLTTAKFTRKGDTWTFTGTSAHLKETVGAVGEEAEMSFQVTPEPGCEDCN